MGDVRDFRKETIELMYENVDTNSSFWAQIVSFGKDIRQDRAARQALELFTQNGSSITDDYESLITYIENVLELNDITKAKLDEILQKVEYVERSHTDKLYDVNYNMLRPLRNDLMSLLCDIDEVAPISTQSVPGMDALPPGERINLAYQIKIMYGYDAKIEDYLGSPEAIARTRLEAERRGIPLNIPESLILASQAKYDAMVAQRQAAIEESYGGDTGGLLPIQAVKQPESGPCLAYCIWAIAMYFGYTDIDIYDVYRNCNVDASNGYYVGNSNYYFNRNGPYNIPRNKLNQYIIDEQAKGNVVMLRLSNPGTHYVVAVGINEDGEIMVMDPAVGRIVTMEEAGRISGNKTYDVAYSCSPK